jgi:16S rRNA (cytosine1402-N4)-methyltransferase
MTSQHVPIMLHEVLEALQPRAGGRYVDCTVDGGGHAAALLAASAPDGRLLGLDADPTAIALARDRLEPYRERTTLVQSNFRAVAPVAAANGFEPCQGVLFDLGLSSDQLAAPARGFSLQHDGPLDMRFDPSGGPTAADLLNESSEGELADIFYQYGEERRSRRLARVVVERRRGRPFARTVDLLSAVEAAVGGKRGRLHPATRVFQALRIAVNDELESLKAGLTAAAEILAAGGRLAVISFHSLEDRIVKRFIQAHSAGAAEPPLRPLTRKPLVPGPVEIEANRRSRSAKLRVAERLSSMAPSQAS